MMYNWLPAELQDRLKQYPNYIAFVNAVENMSLVGGGWNWKLFDAVYRTSWVAEKLVNIIADDMTEKWRKFEHPDKNIVRIRQDFEEQNNMAGVVRRAIFESRLYGGSCILPIIDGRFNEQGLENIFVPASVKKGSLIGFHNLTRYQFAAMDGLSQNIFKFPKYFNDYERYTVIKMDGGFSSPGTFIPNAGNGPAPILHRSWMIKFFGKELPYISFLNQQGWGDSVLVPLLDKIPAVEESFYEMFFFLDSFNVDEIKIANYSALISSGNYNEMLEKFVEIRDTMRAIKLRVMDKNDEMVRNTLSGISEMVPVFQSMLQFLVGMSSIPLTRFLCTSVGGWSSGDNELTQYYDLIALEQKKQLSYQLMILDEIIERHLFGRKVGISYKFLPKRLMTEKEQLENKKMQAEIFSIYLQNKVMTPKIIAENIQEEYVGLTDEYISGLSDDFYDGEAESLEDIKEAEEEKEDPGQAENVKKEN